MMVKGVRYVGIPVSDQDVALEFYTEKMGFKVATDRFLSETERWVELLIPGSDTRLALVIRKGDVHRVCEAHPISLFCDDVFATCEVLRARGVNIAKEPEKQKWGSTAVVGDSDGNTFLLSGRGKPRKPSSRQKPEA